jgi:SUKH-3 immunity protein
MCFQVCKAVKGMDRRWVVEDYEKRLVNSKLCVIGQAYHNHLTLLMDKDGVIYAGYDDLLYVVSNNSLKAIDILCNRPLS